MFTSETSKTIFAIRNVYSKIALRFFTTATTIKIGLWDRIQQQKQKCDRQKNEYNFAECSFTKFEQTTFGSEGAPQT